MTRGWLGLSSGPPQAAAAIMGIALWATPALALDAAEARTRAETLILHAEKRARGPTPAFEAISRPITAAERIAGAEMLLRGGDVPRAVDALSKVLELYRQGKVSEAAYADASFLIGEAYFQSREYTSSRRHHREILDKASAATFRAYAGRCASRLVDIALRTADPEGLPALVARLESLPGPDRSGAVSYARAKAYLALGDIPGARRALGDAPAESLYALRSRYLMGVVLLREAVGTLPASEEASEPGALLLGRRVVPERYAAALTEFGKLAALSAQSPNEQHVIDLAWMAVARLHYEAGNPLEAVKAYGHIERRSPEFSEMLYELAWVHVRLGDFARAQRALEVLSVMDPKNIEAADGSLLRADLMLRAGQFAKARSLYRSVRSKFEPIRMELDRFLGATSDPAVYYDRLIADDEAPGQQRLPAVVLEWAREQAGDQNVFLLIDDVTRSRDLIKATRKLGGKLGAVLLVPSRIKGFPDLRAQAQHALMLANQAARARELLAQGLDDLADSDAAGELAGVRAERRRLMRRLALLPVRDEDFARRDEAGERQWDETAEKLHELWLETDRLNAVVNGLRRLLREPERYAVRVDSLAHARFVDELAAHEAKLEEYKKLLGEYRDAMENGRAQIGFADQRYADDEAAKRRFREVLARELALAEAGREGQSAAEYARAVRPLLARAAALEASQGERLALFERQAAERAALLARQVDAELAGLEQHEGSLDELDHEARSLVGQVALENFLEVRKRLKGIVLRSDVGIVQEAWEVREEQRNRVRNLQRERAREERNLNDELREVLEEAESQ